MSDTPPAAPERTLQGAVQWIQAYKIRGWAFAPHHPEEHLQVEVRLDGAVVAHGAASLDFPLLAKSGIGAGDHGFMLTSSAALPVNEPDRIEAVAIAASGDTLRLHLSKGFGVGSRRSNGAAAASPEEPSSDDGPDDAAPGPVVTGVFHFTPVDRDQRPVFVLGSARSGTSAMARALRKNTRYVGHGEGHLLDLFPKLQKIIDRHYGGRIKDALPNMPTLIAQVPQRTMQDGLQGVFVEIARTVFPAGAWMDKTPGPEMIKAVPALRKIWPESRYIFMKRRPIENIESRRRKFPAMSFKDHCLLWAESMTEWEAVRDQLNPYALEIEQLDMARRPQFVVDQVAALLDLNAEECARLLQSFQHDKPERTTAEFAPTYDLETVGWDQTQRATFLRICGAAMQRFGYHTGAEYMSGA